MIQNRTNKEKFSSNNDDYNVNIQENIIFIIENNKVMIWQNGYIAILTKRMTKSYMLVKIRTLTRIRGIETI